MDQKLTYAKIVSGQSEKKFNGHTKSGGKTSKNQLEKNGLEREKDKIMGMVVRMQILIFRRTTKFGASTPMGGEWKSR